LRTERVSAIENIRPMTRCHAPMDVRRAGLDRRKLGDPRVVGRKLAYRIGCGGIAGEGDSPDRQKPRIAPRGPWLPTALRSRHVRVVK
jgi:hypothetical protein